MANSKSAEKRNRQALTRRAQNRSLRSEMRNTIKKTRTAITEGGAPDLNEKLRDAYSIIDRAAKRNAIKKNAADRNKSRLAQAAKRAAQAES